MPFTTPLPTPHRGTIKENVMNTEQQAVSSKTQQSTERTDAGYQAWQIELQAGRMYEKGATLREVGEFLGTGRDGAFLTLYRLGHIGERSNSQTKRSGA
jgi:hypothetical protein